MFQLNMVLYAYVTFSSKNENCIIQGSSRCLKCKETLSNFNGNCYDYSRDSSKEAYSWMMLISLNMK